MTETSGTFTHPAAESGQRTVGRKVLLGAFPRAVMLPFPASGMVVGRKWLQDLGIRDKEISSRHCQLISKGGLIRDVGSHNGTFVNGVKLHPEDPPTPLPDRAAIRIGQTLLVYRARFTGPDLPGPPLGELAAPFGLDDLRARLSGWKQSRPRVVLIEGETGTGKELAARAVADTLRPGAPYGAVNCAAIVTDLFESTLFGHVRGAFSGATADSRGLLRAHDGGTLFLDEIGELPLATQPKLLRLLQEHEVLPVGSERPVTVDVLMIAATNRDLVSMVENGTLREDLFHRLTPRVMLPALRDRPSDIYAIARALGDKNGTDLSPGTVEVEAVEWLLRRRWSGNVRELAGALAEAAVRDARGGLRKWALEATATDAPMPHGVLTRSTVEDALADQAGNQSEAARSLGVTRDQLLRYKSKLG